MFAKTRNERSSDDIVDQDTVAFVIIAIFLGVWMVVKKDGPEV